MQETVELLKGTWLSKHHNRPWSADRGKIQGSTETEIDAVEQQIGKELPVAMKAWYLVAGDVPPYVNDYDADHSLDDLISAQETAGYLTQHENCQWKLDNNIIAFSQRIGEQFLFVNIAEALPADPPVYHYIEGEAQPHQVAIAFTTYIREKWLEWLDFYERDKAFRNEIGSWIAKGYDDWMSRKRVIDALNDEARKFRIKLIETVYQEDLVKDTITGPHAFQERWVRDFSACEIWEKLQKEGLRMPYGWVDPPTRSS